MPKPQCDTEWMPDVVIYSDAAVANDGTTSISYRLTDVSGTVIEEDGYVLGEPHPSHLAEYIAVLKGISVAMERGYSDPVIYTDYEGLIDHVFGEAAPTDAKQTGLKEKIVTVLKTHCNKWMLEYLPRDQNEAAHELANQAVNECPVPTA